MTEKQMRKKLPNYKWEVPLPAIANHWIPLSPKNSQPPGTYMFLTLSKTEEPCISIKKYVYERNEETMGIKKSPSGFGLIKPMFNNQSTFGIVLYCMCYVYATLSFNRFCI